MTATRRGRPGYDVESLLTVAVSVFNERGYDGTSMEDLAQRLGISKAAIYHHVASKDELLRMAMDRALDGLFSVLAATKRLDATAISKLEHLVRGSIAVLQARLPYVTLLLRARGNTEIERAAMARRRQFDRYVAGLVRQAEADGDVRPDVDPDVTARLLFGMVNSLVEWYRPAHSDLADAICAIAFDGLRLRKDHAMNVNDVLSEALDHVHQTVQRVVDGLTDDQLAHRVDGTANSIAWLVWHLARVQDDHVAEVAGREQVWTSGGWRDRFALPFDEDAIGYGFSSDEVGQVRASAELLAGYYDAVHAATLAFVAGIGEADLDRVVDENWDPPVTLGVRLISVLNDDLQHAGQAAFVRGLLPDH